MELSRNAYRGLVGRYEKKRLRHRCEDNIKIELREVGCDAGDRIDLAQDKIKFAGLCKDDREPQSYLIASQSVSQSVS